MSSVQERKFYLQLWTLTTGPAVKVMKHFFEVKILNNSKFESFLNDQNNMHTLFHQCFPTIPCCKCVTVSVASPKKKGCLNSRQFDMLYDNSGLPQLNHENIKGSEVVQYCLCKYSSKCSIKVSGLDITLFNNIIQHCCPSKMNFIWRKSVKDIRNFLAHAGHGQISKADFESHWKALETATLGFAGEIGDVCDEMFQDEISRILNSSTDQLKDQLKEMLEKSNDDLRKMLDLNVFNPLKTTAEECKTNVKLVHQKQEAHDKQLNKIESSIGQSKDILTQMQWTTEESKLIVQDMTLDIGEVKHRLNNFESIIKVAVVQAIEEEKGKNMSADSRKITVGTQVDSNSWDEENTLRNISNMVKTEIDTRRADTEEFHVKSLENKCILLELVAFPDVFKNAQTLRKAVKSLINQLVKAGEIDTYMPGKLHIKLTVKTPLTKEELAVVFSVFDKHEMLEESTDTEMDVKTNLFDSISITQTLKVEPDSLEKSDVQSDKDVFAPNQQAKMETKDEEKYGSFKTFSQVDSHTLVDKKLALQKLGEIPLIEYQINKYKESIKEIEQKWLLKHLRPSTKLRTKEWRAKLKNLQNEKKQRINKIEKLKDIICKKEDITITEETYGADLGFLNAEMKAIIKCDQCDTKDESQISCYCETCKIFLCDICENGHRLGNKSHCYICRSGILRSYKINHVWSHLDQRLIDIKRVNTNTIAVLTSDMVVVKDKNSVLATYNFTGVLENKHMMSSLNSYSKIARINDSMVAITNPTCNLLHTATIKPTIYTSEVRVSIPIEMTGGIECRSNILYVACTDAIRLIDLSGQVQSSIDVQNVGILHFLNSDKILCVDSYCYAKSSVSCLDLTNNSVSKFINFPFYPLDITSDDVGNIICRADHLIWQADSDGNNFKVIMSPSSGRSNEFNGLSYDKFSKTLITSNSGKSKVLLYNKLEKM